MVTKETECRCGHRIQIPDDWDSATTTCPNCGKTVALEIRGNRAADRAKLCPVCGKKLLPHENWCTRCRAPLKDLLKLRSNPEEAARTGLCPSCGHKLLPKETACRNCHVVVEDFLKQILSGDSTGAVPFCRTCGKQLLPKETACPQCKSPVQIDGGTETV